MIAYDDRQMRNEEERPLAPESLKTKRARDKLLKQWEDENRQITPEALAEATDKMREWIAHNAADRVPIKEKLELFNQNRNAAALSRKVQQISEKLKLDMQQIGKALNLSE